MFLVRMIGSAQDPEIVKVLALIIAQLNLLLSMVNDVLDIKLIESGNFTPKFETFNPLQTLQFIKDIFSPQTEMQKTTLNFKTVSISTLNEAIALNHQEHLMPEQAIPELLKGD